MRQIKEVLRLRFVCQRSQREIATTIGASSATVWDYLDRARRAQLDFDKAMTMEEAALDALLFPPPPSSSRARPAPNWPMVHRELGRKGVTLDLLWNEYKAQEPEGYGYSWFCKHYERWAAVLPVTLRQTHTPGEKLFIDYSGNRLCIVDALLPMTDNIEVGGNGMTFPKDETTPWGTDGVRAYWQAEASQANATKPKLGVSTLRLHKLMALTPVTDELLEDANALESYLPGLMARSIRWKTNEAILFGTGAGQPEGAFNGRAAVVQAKDQGQATKTVSLGNVSNMIARLTPGSLPKSVWMITPDALPSLFGLTLGNYPIYLPISQGAQGSPYGTLMGRPIMVSQHAAAFSAQGDISLIDLSYYRTITKAGGVQTATSMHLYFDADATAFRAIFRVDGQPKIVNPIAQAKGANTLSPFIQLGAR